MNETIEFSKYPGIRLRQTEDIVDGWFTSHGLSEPVEVVQRAAIVREQTIREIDSRLGSDNNLSKKWRKAQLEGLGIDPKTLEILPVDPNHPVVYRFEE